MSRQGFMLGIVLATAVACGFTCTGCTSTRYDPKPHPPSTYDHYYGPNAVPGRNY